jgi:hypothetical protein|tara:strand:- start:767 stop:982 length:216 start_codon:yes stop_codon:yes gene_type:complete
MPPNQIKIVDYLPDGPIMQCINSPQIVVVKYGEKTPIIKNKVYNKNISEYYLNQHYQRKLKSKKPNQFSIK